MRSRQTRKNERGKFRSNKTTAKHAMLKNASFGEIDKKPNRALATKTFVCFIEKLVKSQYNGLCLTFFYNVLAVVCPTFTSPLERIYKLFTRLLKSIDFFHPRPSIEVISKIL